MTPATPTAAPGYLQTASGIHVPANVLDQQSAGAPFGYAGGRGNYSASMPDKAQNKVVFPELRSTHDITSLDRTEILRKARWASRNTGIGNRIVEGIADMVGFLTPSPTTTDHDWNAEAKALFEEVTGSAMIFDQAGEENFSSRQITLTKKLVEDGDCLLAFTETASGNPSTALYESPQIGNPKGKNANEGWFDGVKKNGLHKRLQFGILDESLRPTDFTISSTDAIFFNDAKPHAPRGVSKFAPFVKRLLDVRQMDNDQLAGIHAANLVGFVVQNDLLEATKTRALVEQAMAANTFGSTPTATTPKTHNQEKVFQESGAMINLDLGQKIATVHDERRHPNCEAFVSYLIRDMAWSTKFPPEVLWFLGQLTGPGVRYMIKSGEKAAKTYRRLLKDLYCQRIWVWTISKLVKQGRLRPCNDPRWWKCEWLEPASMTIDLGRDIASGLDARAGRR